MIDWTQPIEFEDGRAAFVQPDRGTEARLVLVVGPVYKNDGRNDKQHSMYYYDNEGCFRGGSKSYYKLRNVDDSASYIPEDWS